MSRNPGETRFGILDMVLAVLQHPNDIILTSAAIHLIHR
jgi:hypothetical protein